MSEIAGRIAALMGAYYQANPQGDEEFFSVECRAFLPPMW